MAKGSWGLKAFAKELPRPKVETRKPRRPKTEIRID
jgi:hypothetical protein